MDADKLRDIDVKNLRFYAAMFREYKWETDVLHWSVFEATLKEIADRIEFGKVRGCEPPQADKEARS